MLYTNNLRLKKPGDNDTTDQVPFNENADIIDLEIKKIIDNIGDLSTLTTTDKTSLVKALNEIKSSLSKIDLSAAKVKLEDLSNLFIATEVESALKEVMTQSNANKTSILELKNEVSANRISLINTTNNIVDLF